MTGFASLTPRRGVGDDQRDDPRREPPAPGRPAPGPSSLSAIESRLRALVQQHVARGRVEVAISIQSRLGQPMVDITVNEAVIEGLSSALERARERGLVVGGLTPGDLLRFPQAISVTDRKDESPDAAIPPAVEAALAAALIDLDQMRTAEGRTCGPSWTGGARSSASCSTAPRRRRRPGPTRCARGSRSA